MKMSRVISLVKKSTREVGREFLNVRREEGGQGSKRQIILLSRTNKNCGGGVNPPAACPMDMCHTITNMDRIFCQINFYISKTTSTKTF